MLKAGLKAGAGQLILLSFQNLDIVYLARYAPAAVVGQYAMISRLCVLGTAVLASTFFAFMPDMLHASANPTEFRKTFKRFFLVSAIFGIAGFLGFVFLAGSIAELFAKRPLPVTDQIASYFGITYLFIAAGAPFYNVLAAFRRERSYLFSICSGAVALLITDLLLVPHYAAKGAAIGQAVAALVILVTSSVLLLRKEILRNPPKFDTAMFAASGPQ